MVIIVCILEYFLFNTLGNKSSEYIKNVGNMLINDIILDNVNNNIREDILTKYNINDLIIINKVNGEVVGVDYNIQNSYKLLVEIKNNIINSINMDSYDRYSYKYIYTRNSLFIEVPFYGYTGNIFLSTMGPNISSKIDLLSTVSGNVSTVVGSYGINSLKLDLYINLDVTSKIVVPISSYNTFNHYEILIGSKVINGKIPSYLGNTYKSTSDNLNL